MEAADGDGREERGKGQTSKKKKKTYAVMPDALLHPNKINGIEKKNNNKQNKHINICTHIKREWVYTL